jgi:hypothetical protein
MFLKDKCITIGNCTDYSHATATLTLADCQNLKNSSGVLCYWMTGDTTCKERTCA